MNFLTTRIAEKLVLVIILFSLAITVVFAGLQAYAKYRENVCRLESQLSDEADSHLQAIAASLEKGDGETLLSLLEHIVEKPEASYATVRLATGEKWHHGTVSADDSVQVSRLIVSAEKSPPTEGVLQVGSDPLPLRKQLYDHFLGVLLLTGLWVFLVAGFILLTFQRLVARHLVSIAKQVKDSNITEGYQPVALQRRSRHNRDEFDQLVDDINTMRERGRQAYKELGRSEQRLLLFFEATEEGILGVDRDGNCSFANDACLRILGLSGYEAVMGIPLKQIFSYRSSAPVHERSECLIRDAYEKICSVDSADGVLTRSDGTTGHMALRVYPVFNDGECSGAIAFFRDIGRERQLNQERALLSEAVRQAPVMVVITNRDSIIEYVNPDVERTTGFRAEELMGRHLDRLVDLTDPAEQQQINEALGFGRPWEGVLKQHTNNDRTLMVSALFSSIDTSRGEGGKRVCVFRDMTYELHLQKQLINSRKMEAVDRLSSSIAHELGNPLFGVRSVVKDLRERESISPEDRELLDMAYQECNRMGRLVRELRRLDQDGEPFIQKHDIEDILERVYLITRYELEQKGVTVDFDLHREPPLLMVDRKQLVLAIINIINNSVESMTPGGGTLRIKTFLENGDVVISIGDTGSGIQSEHRDLVFEPFFSTKPEVEGAGLGLTVAYSIIRGLGGDISFTSEVGKGSTFCVHIPLT